MPKPNLLALSFCTIGLFVTVRASDCAIDFSHAGYGAGGVPIPSVTAKLTIAPSDSDDTSSIQTAIETLSALPPNTVGFRGALVFRPGTYHINGQLRINTSGIVLRGESATFIATGQSRRALIYISGSDRIGRQGPALYITGDAPTGSTQLKIASVDGLAKGMRVLVHRPSTKEWIHALGMDQFTGNFKDIRLTWLPGSRDLSWSRTITSIDESARTVTLDAPITTALESRYGGATIQTHTQPGQLHHVGVEGLILRSEFDRTNPRDEEHAWIAIQLENVEDAWVREVSASNFVSAAVWTGTGTRNITIQDCQSEDPVGENAGWRRFGFYVGGQQTLVQRCNAIDARHPFLAGLCSAGPNVFLDCSAKRAAGESGSIESWASGVLFDNVRIDGGNLVLGNLGARWQGAGWNASNSIIWNCDAKLIAADNAIGTTNQSITDSKKLSLYRMQLAARLGEKSLTGLARTALPAPTDLKPTHRQSTKSEATDNNSVLSINNGRFMANQRALFGGATSNAWWKGQTIPARAAELGWNVTRWSPGRTGPGLTEDLAILADKLAARDNTLVQVWPGLWYDRRRDDHQTVTRENADVWAPFYEQPWARSGQGVAADGLSKYDLTKFNPWYWSRLREFAIECAHRDMILYHHFYNHHNLVESAAHWADFPWRPANCLQQTGFQEPPPYTNDGTRIGVVEQFYDVSDPVRRELHRAFIRHGLDALADQPNVVHTLGFQFAGPLSFQQFFLDTVAEWQIAHSKRVHIALNTSKAITDAILADPIRASLVDVIDERYWQYLVDGSLFAPDSGGKLAFREQRTTAFGQDAIPPGKPELVYKQVREYRDRFPEKAIICGHAGQGPIPILMAGGALPLLADYASSQPLKSDRDDHAFIIFVREHLAALLATMHPVDLSPNAWCLADGKGGNRLYFSPTGEQLSFGQPIDFNNSTGLWFDPKTGTSQPAHLNDSATIAKPSSTAWLLLVQCKR
jgi:hypothetical protein